MSGVSIGLGALALVFFYANLPNRLDYLSRVFGVVGWQQLPGRELLYNCIITPVGFVVLIMALTELLWRTYRLVTKV